MKKSIKFLAFGGILAFGLLLAGCGSGSSFYGIVPKDYTGLMVFTHEQDQPNDFLRYLSEDSRFLPLLNGEWEFVAAVDEVGELIGGIKTNKAVEIAEILKEKKYAFFYKREKDVLLFGKDENVVDEAISRMNKGVTADLTKSGFGYIELRNKKIGKLKMDLLAEESGVKIKKYYEGEHAAEIFADTVPQIYKKIPLTGPVVYLEEPFFMPPIFRDYFLASVAPKITLSTGVELSSLKTIVSSPFAFALGEAEGFLPTLAFYFQLDEKNDEAGKDAARALDAFVVAILEEFSSMVPEGAELFKKETLLMDGAGVFKLSVNWGALPQGLKIQLGLVPGLIDQPAEIFYGQTSDNLLFVALYPGFADVYGQEVLAENAVFKKALASLKDPVGQLHFVETGALSRFTSEYLSSVFVLGKVSKEAVNLLNFSGKLIEKFEYSIGSFGLKEGKVYGQQVVRNKF